MELFCRLEKFDPFLGIAEGVAACEQPDRDREVFDYAGSKPYFQRWSDSVHKDSSGKSFGNVRFQHDDKRPVGHLESLTFDDAAKCIRVIAKINEPVARQMLADGDLTGFSIGGGYVKKTPMANGFTRYIANPSEISVVDRPCAPSATFTVKTASGGELRKSFRSVEIPPFDQYASPIQKSNRAYAYAQGAAHAFRKPYAEFRKDATRCNPNVQRASTPMAFADHSIESPDDLTGHTSVSSGGAGSFIGRRH